MWHVLELSVLSFPFFCKPEIVLKNVLKTKEVFRGGVGLCGCHPRDPQCRA